MGKPPLLHDKACPYKMMDYTYAYAVQVLRTHLLRRTTLRNGNKKTQAPADAGACVVSCWLKKEGEPKKMASLKKQMLPSARRVATCRDCTLRNIFEHQAFICNIPPAVATGRDPTS